MGDIIQQFDSKYAPSSLEYQAIKKTSLVCAGCSWVFPGSYILGLSGALDNYVSVTGATPGYDEFSKTGICTKCGSAESFLTYQRESSSINQADVDAIRLYWRILAVVWWRKDASRSTAICDGCNDLVGPAEESYLIGNNLECKRCTDKNLADGLNKLRRDPHYFGATELQKARSFAAANARNL